MSSFLFNRRPAPENQAEPSRQPDAASSLAALAQAQSITASAIFAMLVSKGVLSPQEAAQYMNELASVLQRDVGGTVGAQAADTLASYAEALVAAGA
jgi:chaperone required for assembly of F1-ATPase